jgi:hypothetical protein
MSQELQEELIASLFDRHAREVMARLKDEPEPQYMLPFEVLRQAIIIVLEICREDSKGRGV